MSLVVKFCSHIQDHAEKKPSIASNDNKRKVKMKKQISKVSVVFLVLLIASSATISVAASPKLATSPCQCVKLITNTLFDGRILSGGWDYAYQLADKTYWKQAKDTFGIGLYIQQLNPTTAQAGDVIIMQPDAIVWVKTTTGWQPVAKSSKNDTTTRRIGMGYGHIGFVDSASYYKNAEKVDSKFQGLSGWVITMRSANWGTNYDKDGLTYPTPTDPKTPNIYSTTGIFSKPQNGCNNVTDSLIFLPTGNPVSFWREKK